MPPVRQSPSAKGGKPMYDFGGRNSSPKRMAPQKAPPMLHQPKPVVQQAMYSQGPMPGGEPFDPEAERQRKGPPDTGSRFGDEGPDRRGKVPDTGCDVCDEDVLEQERMEDEMRSEAEWHNIRSKIDSEYQKKLKEVNDEALHKLKVYEQEHSELLDKTQYLYDEEKRKRPESVGSRQRSSSATRRQRSTGRLSRQSRQSGRASDASSNYSFISNQSGGGRKDRNRFFSPKQMASQPEPAYTQQESAETTEIKRFYKEYCAVVKRNFTQDNQIYLIDVLEQLHFLDDESVNDYKNELCRLIQDEHKPNFMFFSKSGQYSGESEDIIKNLFKICCGIQDLKLKQRGHNPLDQKLLKSYTTSINFSNPNQNFILMDQLHTIKSLITRKAFTLSHQQIEHCHEIFRNMYLQRKEFKDIESKMRNPERYELTDQRGRQIYYTPKTTYVPEAPQVIHQAIQPQYVAVQEPAYAYKQVVHHVQAQPQQPPPRQAKPAVLYQETMQQRSPRQQRPWSGTRPRGERSNSATRRQGPPKLASPAQFVAHQSPIPAPHQEPPPYNAQQRSPHPMSDPRRRNSEPRGQGQPYYSPNAQAHRPVQHEPRYSQGEPLCVLKIELDGEHVQEIKVYEGDDPNDIVERFGKKFNLSNNAKRRLLEQINDQINSEDITQ